MTESPVLPHAQVAAGGRARQRIVTGERIHEGRDGLV
jgi:hypothetical protein